MSDTSLPQVIQYGTQAERIAFTPNPAVGSQVLYLWYETDNEPDTYAWNGTTWEQINSASGSGITQLTGDVTAGPGSGSQAATIAANAITTAKILDLNVTTGKLADDAVTNAKAAHMADSTIKGRAVGAGTGDPTDLTVAQVTTILNNVIRGVVSGRLTTESGVPVSPLDRTAQSTIYFALFNGNQLALYNGTIWILVILSELSLVLSGLTDGKNYDVFVDYNAGTPQLILGSAWTNDTTRADALVLQDGVYVKGGGDTDHRYVGTIRTTGTTTTEDSAAKRFVWNAYNRTERPMVAAKETTDTWAYFTTAYRQANANVANQLMYVVGLNYDMVAADVHGVGYSATNNVNLVVGVGVNSTTTNSAHTFGSFTQTTHYINLSADYRGMPGIGYNFLAWLEYGGSGGNFKGDEGTPTTCQAGISGWVRN